MQTSNYLVDGNPFNLPGPPATWLQKLHDFDDSLVVMPSRMGFFYRLAQRRPPDPKAILTHRINNDSDSQVMVRHGLVPVTTIKATARWDNPLMFEDLRQRMPSRMGGWEKYEQALISKEKEADLRMRADRDDMLTQVAKDSHKFYDLKRGVRSNLWSPKTPDHRPKPANKAPLIKIVTEYSKLRGD